MLTGFKRIVRSGWEKFARDKSSSGAALFTMVIVLSVVAALYCFQGASSFFVSSLQESVDISAYIADTASSEDIEKLEASVKALPEVKQAEFISKEEALERFVNDHKNDEVILQSLEVLGQNPLSASLNIKARGSEHYPAIAEFLEDPSLSSVVSFVDYRDRARIIERLEKLADGIRGAALFFIVFAGLIGVLVAFNTTRLTIYSSRDEVEVMRLVGAGNWYIRGPFLMQGVVVGVFATLIVLLFMFPAAMFLGVRVSSFVPGFDLFQFFASNIVWILLLQLGVGIGLGVFSALIAIRKYLKV
ncbi:MAG: ABC transporter permease [Candidatus Wildermuthbacteria bacterium]|nr:ABC transporter permease [Candidatus Wildermuthbacteria bacterium]